MIVALMSEFNNNKLNMIKRTTTWIKKYWKTFDDSLINPPVEKDSKKNFKGQNIYRRTLADGGPKPTPEQVLQKYKIM